jgi:FO synthase
MLCDLEDVDAVRATFADDRPLDRVIANARPSIAGILERALARDELSVDDGIALLTCDGADFAALARTADAVRAADVGDDVTYVINRNINFTNVCFVGCQFCAFARHRKDEDAYTHGVTDVLAKVQQAVDRNASEICMQGGINPDADQFVYRDLLIAIKAKFPHIHDHAFSPMEIKKGTRRTGMSTRDNLTMLRDAGLGTVPGTAAEILDDEVREILSHKKVDVRTWIEIITTAHELGLRSSSTIMYGHIETPAHLAHHLVLLRSIQKQTGGFTEFVPLRFIHTESELYRYGLVMESPPRGLLVLRIYASSRLMLRGWFVFVQTSWVKLGTKLSQLTLLTGCNDFGGTLMEEQISKSAGVDAGEYLPETEICALIRAMGRNPVQRTTTYGRIAADGAPETNHGAGWGSRGGTVSPGPLLSC